MELLGQGNFVCCNWEPQNANSHVDDALLLHRLRMTASAHEDDAQQHVISGDISNEYMW